MGQRPQHGAKFTHVGAAAAKLLRNPGGDEAFGLQGVVIAGHEYVARIMFGGVAGEFGGEPPGNGGRGFGVCRRRGTHFGE